MRNQEVPGLKIKSFIVLFSLILLLTGCAQKDEPPAHPSSLETSQLTGTSQLPAGFVYVGQVIPAVLVDMRYYGENNFAGTPIDGYNAPVAILTEKAAAALQAVDQDLGRQGYGLKIFDAYRPQKAVDHFARWSQDRTDQKMKALYYPNVNKADFFNLGYLAYRSGHSRGSAVDVTVVDRATGAELDMGGPFDLLDPVSGWYTTLITPEQSAHRRRLKKAMEAHGFRTISTEWWHWQLIAEPYPDTYFDFDVQ